MDEDNQLIKRWDNSPHHEDVDTFPHHVHTENGVKSSNEMTTLKVFERIENLVLENI